MSFEEQPDEDHSECKRAYETAIAEIAAKAQTEWAARNDAEKRASAYKAEKEIAEHSLLEAQAQGERMREVLERVRRDHLSGNGCFSSTVQFVRENLEKMSLPTALQAALDEARAEAFGEAISILMKWMGKRGELATVKSDIEGLLKARARSPSPSATTGEEPKP